jgi:uncharacterized repeat protein (TIGR03847 family)
MGTEESFEFNEVTLISAFAVGIPGKRTFFMGIGNRNNWVRIWLEKEHLQALAGAIEQLLSTLSQEQIDVPREEETGASDDVPKGLPSAELDVVQMQLGYEEGKATLEIIVQRAGANEPNPLEVHCRVLLAQLKKLGNQAIRVCAAGRTPCPICGGPIDPEGHVCPAQN